ncbi:MAG TPA: phage holin family protein [Candidatus Acidoferrum sp.]|jgi:uncharacterized membrane protein YqjE
MATPQTQRTVSDVLQDIIGNVQQIIRSEFRLAKAELKEKADRASKPAVFVASGALIAVYGLGFLFLAAVYGLAVVMPEWAAALIVGAVLSIIGVMVLSSGRAKLKAIDPTPDKTVQTLKENVQWAKEQIK